MSDYSHLPVAYGSLLDVFATELTAVESLGPCVRLVFTAPTQQGTDAYRERVASVVIPNAALPAMMQMLARTPRKIGNGEPEATLDTEEFGHFKASRH